MQIPIGCSGWFYWQGRGILYPDPKRTDYTPEELSEWTRKITENGAREVWLYFDNDREGFVIKNAQELSAQRRAIGLDVR